MRIHQFHVLGRVAMRRLRSVLRKSIAVAGCAVLVWTAGIASGGTTAAASAGPFRSIYSWTTPSGQHCQVLHVPVLPGERVRSNSSTVTDFNRNVLQDAYWWRSPDGAQVKVYHDPPLDPQLYIINIAGSTDAIISQDLNNLFENLWSEGGLGIDKTWGDDGYVTQVVKSVIDAVGPDGVIPDGSKIMLTGHSQGGNIAQLVALALLKRQYTTDPNWTALRDAFTAHNLRLVGGFTAGSRPAAALDAINRGMAGQGTFWTFENAVNDNVAQLGSTKTFTDADWAWSPDLGALGTDLASLIAQIGPNTGQLNALVPWASTNVSLVQDRSQIYFPDSSRSSGADIHGQSYIDPTVPPVGSTMSVQTQNDVSTAIFGSTTGVDVLANDYVPGANPRPDRADIVTGSITVELNPDLPPAVGAAAAGITARWNAATKKIDITVPPASSYSDGGAWGSAFPLTTTAPFRLAGTDSFAPDVRIVYNVASASTPNLMRSAELNVDVTQNPSASPWSGGPFYNANHFSGPGSWNSTGPVFPAQAPIWNYLPGYKRTPSSSNLQTPLQLDYLGGYGFDCRGQADLSGNVQLNGGDNSLCKSAPWSAVDQGVVTIGAQVLQAGNDPNVPDGIPDNMWVQQNDVVNNVTGDASELDRTWATKWNDIQNWTTAGTNKDTLGWYFNTVDDPASIAGSHPFPLITMNRQYVACGGGQPLPPLDPLDANGCPRLPGSATGAGCALPPNPNGYYIYTRVVRSDSYPLDVGHVSGYDVRAGTIISTSTGHRAGCYWWDQQCPASFYQLWDTVDLTRPGEVSPGQDIITRIEDGGYPGVYDNPNISEYTWWVEPGPYYDHN